MDPDATSAPLPSAWYPADTVAGPGGQLDTEALNALDPYADADADILDLPGGSVRLRTLLDFAATLPPADWTAVRDQAAERGLTVADEWRRERRADWQMQVTRWSGLFGFRSGMGSEVLKAGALDALGASGQAAELARREIHAHLGLLERYLTGAAELAEATDP